MSAFAIDDLGWLVDVRREESPNYDERPNGEEPSLLVIHAISLPPGEFGGDGVFQLFTNVLDAGAHPYFAQIKHLRVSAHFFIRRDGELIQFVPCNARAWHAGISEWQGRQRCNDFSIGIELEGADDQQFAPPQYARLLELIGALRARYPISSIAGHSDIAPDRKTDPGPFFEWKQLLRNFPDVSYSQLLSNFVD
jgi:AmpD protein